MAFFYHYSHARSERLEPDIGEHRDHGEDPSALNQPVVWLYDREVGSMEDANGVMEFLHIVEADESDPNLHLARGLDSFNRAVEQGQTPIRLPKEYFYKGPLAVKEIRRWDGTRYVLDHRLGQTGPSMRMVKQRPTVDGTRAMDCGVCVVAMLTDLSYEEVLSGVPQYRTTSDLDWMNVVMSLGFETEVVDATAPPLGRRLFCSVMGMANDEIIQHAIAVDEAGRIFDPANGTPEPGAYKVADCLTRGTFTIHLCFAVGRKRK